MHSRVAIVVALGPLVTGVELLLLLFGRGGDELTGSPTAEARPITTPSSKAAD